MTAVREVEPGLTRMMQDSVRRVPTTTTATSINTTGVRSGVRSGEYVVTTNMMQDSCTKPTTNNSDDFEQIDKNRKYTNYDCLTLMCQDYVSPAQSGFSTDKDMEFELYYNTECKPYHDSLDKDEFKVIYNISGRRPKKIDRFVKQVLKLKESLADISDVGKKLTAIHNGGMREIYYSPPTYSYTLTLGEHTHVDLVCSER